MEQNRITPEYSTDSEEKPELEEDWDSGQFADAKTTLITKHNTHSESERIRWDYTQQLLDLSDNQYYEEETPVNQLQYCSPDPDYYSSPTRRSQKHPVILMVTTLHHLTQQTFSTGTHVAEANRFYYMGTDFLVRKLDLLKVGKPGREEKITENQ